MRYSLRTLLIAAVVLGALIGLAGQTVVQFVKTAKFGHRHVVEMTFNQLPVNDDALRDWIISQPGISNRAVHRPGKANTVRIEWWEFRRIFEPPPPDPDVATALSQLGYKAITPKPVEKKIERDQQVIFL